MLAGNTNNSPKTSPNETEVSAGGCSPLFSTLAASTQQHSISNASPMKYINPEILNYRSFSASPQQVSQPLLQNSFSSPYEPTTVDSKIYHNPFYYPSGSTIQNNPPSYYNYANLTPYKSTQSNVAMATKHYNHTNALSALNPVGTHSSSYNIEKPVTSQPQRVKTRTDHLTDLQAVDQAYNFRKSMNISSMAQASPNCKQKRSKSNDVGIYTSDDSCDTYILASPEDSLNITPDNKYQVALSDGRKAKVKGREISSHYNQPGFYYVFFKNSFHTVHQSNVRRIKKKKKNKCKNSDSLKPEEQGSPVRLSPRIVSPELESSIPQKAASPIAHQDPVEPAPKQEAAETVDTEKKDDTSEGVTTQEYVESYVHVLLSDQSGEFWAEVPTQSIKPQVVGHLYNIQHDGKVYKDVPKSKLVPIESEPPPWTGVERKTMKSVRVLLGKKWKYMTDDKVKPSLRKPGTYVIRMPDRNIRVHQHMVEFLPNYDKQEKTSTVDTSSISGKASTNSVHITDYTAFLKGKFERLPAKKVHPIAAKPGFYKILCHGTNHIVHMNLVLPIIWNDDRSEETVIAPTHFRVLSPSVEFIVTAAQVRPDPHNTNLFIIKLDNGTYQRVKSSLLYPLWINSDTLCSTKDIIPESDVNKSGESQGFKEKNYHFRIFKDGDYMDYHADDVKEWSNRPGFFRIYFEGEWVHHPAYCISKIKHRESGVYSTPVPWQYSLRSSYETSGVSKPTWKNYYPSESQRSSSRSKAKSYSFRKDSDHTTCESSVLTHSSEFSFDHSESFRK